MFRLHLSRNIIGFLLLAMLVLAVLLISSVRVAGIAAEPGRQEKPKQAEKPAPAAVLDITGQLQDNDPIDPVKNEPCKTYMVKLKKGKTYAIDMASTDFDSYLRLEDAKGKPLAADDDSGGELNAQIMFHAEADGNFKVIATRFANAGAGQFTLTVKQIAFKTGKVHALKDGGLTITDKLAANDAANAAGLKSPHKLYTIKLLAGKTYTIDMASTDFDTYLRLMDSKFRTVAMNDDSGGGTDSRIEFTPKIDGNYHIIATTFDGEIGGFTLTVKEGN